MNRKVIRPRARSGRMPIFILLALILILIGIIAIVFSAFVMQDLSSEAQANQTNILADSQAVLSDEMVSGESGENKSSSKQEDSSNQDDIATEHRKIETWVPKMAKVDVSYFDDAIFIGDSISMGFRINGIIPDKQVFAEKNVGLDKVVLDKPVYYTTGKTPKTLFSAIAEKFPYPKKIYILLGSNGLPGYSNKDNIAYYYQLIDRLKNTYPDAIVYVESLTPVTSDSEYLKRFSIKKINEFNDLIFKMAEEKNIYYLNVCDAVKDSNGYLKTEYEAGDGMHMISVGHKAMYQYYRTHAVQPDGFGDVIIEKGK